LSSNKISSTPELINHFIEFFHKNNKLRELDLSNNHLTDIKIILKNLEKLNHLTSINLSRNPIINDDINLVNEKLQYNLDY